LRDRASATSRLILPKNLPSKFCTTQPGLNSLRLSPTGLSGRMPCSSAHSAMNGFSADPGETRPFLTMSTPS
jgi:hypothetical protein